MELAVDKIQPGMITAQGIYCRKGENYLSVGDVVTAEEIAWLKKMGILTLNVLPPSEKGAAEIPHNIVEEQTRVIAIHDLYKTMKELVELGNLNVESLQTSAQKILVDVVSNKENLVQLTDIRLHDDYTFSHSGNVAILSAMIGVLLGYDEENLIDLVIGGLLHDVGKIIVPESILQKSTGLSNAEFDIIRQHPAAGAVRLLQLDIPKAELYAAIASQHHEHLDGKGYPNHLKADQIITAARIVAIADVYDALTSSRAYKAAYKPHIAYQIMSQLSPGQFDMKILELFFNNVAIYPMGTVLRTTMGYAVVRKSEFGRTLTPTVRLFADPDGNALEPRLLDLFEYPSDTIKGVLDEMELLTLIHLKHLDPASFMEA